jgi:hypothetical protein
MISHIVNLAAKRHPIFKKRPARAAGLSQSSQYA